MSFEYRTGDILQSGAGALVNSVNCRGVMGAGLAREFARRYPKMEAAYKLLCREQRFTPGVCIAYFTRGPVIFNLATKDDWRQPSRIEWVEAGVRQLVEELAYADRVRMSERISTIAIPMLGCGYGGLAWHDVRPLIENAFREHPTRALIYGEAPRGGRE